VRIALLGTGWIMDFHARAVLEHPGAELAAAANWRQPSLAAFAARGLAVSPHKVGPDYIDPGYHSLATGRPGRNLDAFLSGPDLIGPLFTHGARGTDIGVVEGVMGLFDGKSGGGEYASTAHVAKLLRAQEDRLQRRALLAIDIERVVALAHERDELAVEVDVGCIDEAALDLGDRGAHGGARDDSVGAEAAARALPDDARAM
jgi:hypothetical protein